MENYLNENFSSVKPKNSSEEALQRWRALYTIVKNQRRRFRMVADLDKRSEAEKKRRKSQEKTRVALYVRKAALRFADVGGQFKIKSEPEDESLREHLLTEAAEARTNQEPKLDHVPSREHIWTEAAEAGRNQESVDDVGSADNKKIVSKLLHKYKKCALALFYVLLEAASFSLDIIGKMKWRILLAAFVLSAFSFAISMYSCIMRRTRAATRVHWQTQLVWMVEISFSVVQLVVTLVNFTLAELGVKNKFDASVFPLVFAVIVAAFNIIYVREVSDSSGLASSLTAPAADRELQDLQDVEANGNLSTALVADHQLQNILVHKPHILAKDAEANNSLSMGPAADLHNQNVHGKDQEVF